MRLIFEACFGDCIVGECPFWIPKISAWSWVDNKSGYLYLKGIGTVQRLQSEHHIMFAAPVGDQDWCIATSEGVFCGLNQRRPISQSKLRDQRYNDGKIDSMGRLWIGSVGLMPELVAGALYCVDEDIVCVDADLNICNGIAFSADSRFLFLVDTGRRLIYVYDFDVVAGKIENRRVFCDLAGQTGKPDGIAFGPNGSLYCAMWDGACLLEILPNGRVCKAIPTPVIRPTSIAFGDRHLIVTSAKVGLSEAQLELYPLSGKTLLYRIET